MIQLLATDLKKFAILVISDGIERFELPVWPELFEQKSRVLQENQLILAILQVDKNEDDLRLQCKWLEDLSCVTDERIKEIEIDYQRIAKQAEGEKKQKTKSKPNPGVSLKNDSVQLIVDIQKLSLKKILKLKESLVDIGGATPLIIIFNREGKKIATLEIEDRSGIKSLEALQEKMNGESYVISVL